MLNGPHRGRILPWPSSSRLNQHLLQLRGRCILQWLHRSPHLQSLQYAPPPLVIKGRDSQVAAGMITITPVQIFNGTETVLIGPYNQQSPVTVIVIIVGRA